MTELEDLFNEVMSIPAIKESEVGTRVCSKCCEEKSLSSFSYASRTPADRRNGVQRKKAQCKVCDSRESQAWQADNKEYKRRYDMVRHFSKKYSLEKSLAEALVDTDIRRGMCPICRSKADLVVDHDHDSGIARDLICSACNSMLGYAKENIGTLYEAIAYLKKHKGV